MIEALHELVARSAAVRPDHAALVYKGERLSYDALWSHIREAAGGLRSLGLARGDRIGIYLDKRPETIAAFFGASAAGGVFVPVNPVLKAPQVAYILQDCAVRVLVTSRDRFAILEPALGDCPALEFVVLVDAREDDRWAGGPTVLDWQALQGAGASNADLPPRVIDLDMAAILYTSGSTGHPKGVVLSHRNLVVGAQSVSQYLENRPEDRILSVLPLSFDAGLSQVTTAFAAGATCYLLNYLLPRDVARLCAKERITGMTGVPPLWIQLSELDWPDEARQSLRYFANTGGHMPRTLLGRLRETFPQAKPYLMYGLTEAFRSTYLDPAEVDRRPDSMGKAIPNAEILVVNRDGQLCAPGEEGELVHRGALVAMGYWGDPERTAERFRPIPGRPAGLPLDEIAVWSGDIVKTDEDGFLYFVGRRDDMIKTSGYRVSSTEIEEVIYATGLTDEAAAIGLPHPLLGQGIAVVVKPKEEQSEVQDRILAACRQSLPLYMVPAMVVERESLPRNPNGKIDRRLLAEELKDSFAPGGAARETE